MSDPSDQLTIETPEQIDLEFALAGLGSRSLAFLVDSLVQLIFFVVIGFALSWFASHNRDFMMKVAPGNSQYENWIIAALLFLIFCIYWGYFAAFEILWHGQTPGKRYAKVRVISRSGRSITAMEGIARNFLRAVDGLFFYVVGILSVALDSRNRRLGDMAAGTLVVHEESRATDAYWYSSGSRAQGEALPAGTGQMTATEFTTVESFLGRRLELPLDVQQRLGAALAWRIGKRLQIDASLRPSNDNFLEEMVRRYRDQSVFRG